MVEQPNKCAYCPRTGKLSREHIFPDWLKNYVPRAFLKTIQATSFTGYSLVTGKRSDELIRGALFKSGDPHSHRFPIVCVPCNTQWMSALQNKAKRYLVSLISDDWRAISNIDRSVVAAWVAMLTMNFECVDKGHRVTPQSQRNYLREYRAPPPNWYVWLGRIKGERWKKGTNRLCWSSGSSPLLSYRQQSLAFDIGSLFVLATNTWHESQELGLVDSEQVAQDHSLCVLWPLTNVPMFKPSLVLGDKEADAASQALTPEDLKGTFRKTWDVPESLQQIPSWRGGRT